MGAKRHHHKINSECHSSSQMKMSSHADYETRVLPMHKYGSDDISTFNPETRA
jgi:hypothetical protein